MNEKLKETQALLDAISSCPHGVGTPFEEQGGFIVNKQGVYEFIKIPNQNAGTRIAASLYTANRDEFSRLISQPFADGKHIPYASFHTHPPGYGAGASTTDLTYLFTGFPINFVYAPDFRHLHCYTFSKDKNLWQLKRMLVSKDLKITQL
jgi:hypothetical protein